MTPKKRPRQDDGQSNEQYPLAKAARRAYKTAHESSRRKKKLEELDAIRMRVAENAIQFGINTLLPCAVSEIFQQNDNAQNRDQPPKVVASPPSSTATRENEQKQIGVLDSISRAQIPTVSTTQILAVPTDQNNRQMTQTSDNEVADASLVNESPVGDNNPQVENVGSNQNSEEVVPAVSTETADMDLHEELSITKKDGILTDGIQGQGVDDTERSEENMLAVYTTPRRRFQTLQIAQPSPTEVKIDAFLARNGFEKTPANYKLGLEVVSQDTKAVVAATGLTVQKTKMEQYSDRTIVHATAAVHTSNQMAQQHQENIDQAEQQHQDTMDQTEQQHQDIMDQTERSIQRRFAEKGAHFYCNMAHYMVLAYLFLAVVVALRHHANEFWNNFCPYLGCTKS